MKTPNNSPWRTYAKKQPVKLQEFVQKLYGQQARIFRSRNAGSYWAYQLRSGDEPAMAIYFYHNEERMREILTECADAKTPDKMFSNGNGSLWSKNNVRYFLGLDLEVR